MLPDIDEDAMMIEDVMMWDGPRDTDKSVGSKRDGAFKRCMQLSDISPLLSAEDGP